MWEIIYAEVTKKLTQSLLSHVDNNTNISFQLKLDQALVQGSDKNIRYLYLTETEKKEKQKIWDMLQLIKTNVK